MGENVYGYPPEPKIEIPAMEPEPDPVKCPRCGEDPTPVIVGNMRIKPCGLVAGHEPLIQTSAGVLGCPMNEWQRGYLDALATRAKGST